MSRKVYLAFGDSITDGYGVTKGFVSWVVEKIKTAYPDLELFTILSGMSGDNTRDGLYRLGRELENRTPDLVTINFGVNDAFSGISSGMFASNLTDMVKMIQDKGCERIVLLSCEVIPDARAEQIVLPYWEAMEKVALENGVIYSDVNGRWRDVVAGGVNQWDLIIPGDMHPNEAGHKLIGEAVFDTIESNGLLESSKTISPQGTPFDNLRAGREQTISGSLKNFHTEGHRAAIPASSPAFAEATAGKQGATEKGKIQGEKRDLG
jgi:lysophospholipase L1-like esterase